MESAPICTSYFQGDGHCISCSAESAGCQLARRTRVISLARCMRYVHTPYSIVHSYAHQQSMNATMTRYSLRRQVNGSKQNIIMNQMTSASPRNKYECNKDQELADAAAYAPADASFYSPGGGTFHGRHLKIMASNPSINAYLCEHYCKFPFKTMQP